MQGPGVTPPSFHHAAGALRWAPRQPRMVLVMHKFALALTVSRSMTAEGQRVNEGLEDVGTPELTE